MKPYFEEDGITIYHGDCREVLPRLDQIHCCVTSPPYWGLRDYGVEEQIGLEKTVEEYIAIMVGVFREVKRVLRDDGTLWLNMGDSYASAWACGRPSKIDNGPATMEQRQKRIARGSGRWVGGNNGDPELKEKDLIGVPWMLAFALRADGWYLRSDIIWAKPNPMPESVTDRPTKAHEYIFLLSKSERYYYNQEAILEKVNGTAHVRGDGVNPKCYAAPTGWNQGEGRHDTIVGRYEGKNEKSGNRLREGFNERWRVKQNESFSSAVNELVEARNKRTVWEVASQPFPEAHFATFPEELIKPCILAGCPAGGTVLDPFIGSGTTALVARNLQCKCVGIELNPEYIEIAAKRLSQKVFAFP